MTEKIIIAGAGGQGVMLLGKIMAKAALILGYQVTWFPSYGAEVRGGTANCMVTISSRRIPSPYVMNADTLITLNEPSFIKFNNKLIKSGLLLANSSLIDDKKLRKISKSIKKIYLPFTDLAIKLGNIKVTNMIVLGTYLREKKILTKGSVFNAFRDFTHKDKRALIEINKLAIERGMDLIK